jgi:hypothetical protein
MKIGLKTERLKEEMCVERAEQQGDSSPTESNHQGLANHVQPPPLHEVDVRLSDEEQIVRDVAGTLSSTATERAILSLQG